MDTIVVEESDPPLASPQNTLQSPIIFLVLVWSVILAMATLALYFPVWTAEQFSLALGGNFPVATRIGVVVVHGLIVMLPALFVGRVASNPYLQSVARAWTVAGLFVFFTIPIQLTGLTADVTAAIIQILAAALFVLAIRFVERRDHPPRPEAERRGSLWPVVVATALVGWPWFIWGAAGAPIDILLNAIAAVFLGLAVALVIRRHLRTVWRSPGPASRTDIFAAGLTAGVILLTMGSSYGANGQELILMFVLPALAWLAIILTGFASATDERAGWPAIALLVGLVAAAPMIFVDPDELNLILNLGSRDVGYWTSLATLTSTLIALALGGLLLALWPRTESFSIGKMGTILALAVLAISALLYAGMGQTGLHGERLFVIMADQAETAALSEIDDYQQRRETAYNQLVSHANETQAELRQALDRFNLDYTPYYLVNGIEVSGGPLVKLWLESRPDIDRVLLSPRLRPLPQLPATAHGNAESPQVPDWNLTQIGAPDVWETFDTSGTGIVIGQADSGVELDHPEFQAQYRGNADGDLAGHDYNWFDPWHATLSPEDIGGHGTHTLGSILGQNVGVAPDATWIACVNLGRNLGNPALYLDCMQFLFAPFPLDGDPFQDGRPVLGAHVFNNSWGCPEIEGCDPGSLEAAVEALRDAGVFMVVSAGNDGDACESVTAPPAIYDDVFSVGAFDAAGNVADFSSRGPVTVDGSGRTKPELLAPGVDVLSSFPGKSYEYSDGTSMAGPHVAGTVALIWSANPDLIGDIDRTETILTSTARPYDLDNTGEVNCGDPTKLHNNITGYGLLDAYAAVEMAVGE